MKWLHVTLLLFIIFFIAATYNNMNIMADESDNESNEEEVKISISKVHAQIDPDLEFALPEGAIQASFRDRFGKMRLKFYLKYAFIANSIDGSVTLSWPFEKVVPAITFFDGVAFENYIKPVVSGDDLILTPTDKYISRERGVDMSLGITLARHLKLTTGFQLKDVYKGDLTNATIIDKGIDLIQGNSLTYNNIKRKSYDHLLPPQGIYFSTTIDTRFRSGYILPLSIDHRNNLLVHTIIGANVFITTDLSVSYPLIIWEKDPTEFYSLGGYNSMRGYLQDEISAFRFILLSEDFEYQFPLIEWEIENVFETSLTFTGFRILVLLDGLLTQERLNIRSQVNGYASIGGGLAFTIVESEERDWVFKLYLAQALQPDRMPILYFKISNYRFRTRL